VKDGKEQATVTDTLIDLSELIVPGGGRKRKRLLTFSGSYPGPKQFTFNTGLEYVDKPPDLWDKAKLPISSRR
jgi:hypothetical protein